MTRSYATTCARTNDPARVVPSPPTQDSPAWDLRACSYVAPRDANDSWLVVFAWQRDVPEAQP